VDAMQRVNGYMRAGGFVQVDAAGPGVFYQERRRQAIKRSLRQGDGNLVQGTGNGTAAAAVAAAAPGEEAANTEEHANEDAPLQAKRVKMD